MIWSRLLSVNSHTVRTGQQRQLERVWCDCFTDVTTDTLQHSSGCLTSWKDSHSNNGHFKVLHVSPAWLRAVFQGIPNKNIYICHKYCTETLRGFISAQWADWRKGFPNSWANRTFWRNHGRLMHIFWIIVFHFGALDSFMLQTVQERKGWLWEKGKLNESQSVVL